MASPLLDILKTRLDQRSPNCGGRLKGALPGPGQPPREAERECHPVAALAPSPASPRYPAMGPATSPHRSSAVAPLPSSLPALFPAPDLPKAMALLPALAPGEGWREAGTGSHPVSLLFIPVVSNHFVLKPFLGVDLQMGQPIPSVLVTLCYGTFATRFPFSCPFSLVSFPCYYLFIILILFFTS